ncbi:hypothetical protein IWW37_000489 [Coemansia sp. RSA 2050]|nr:hypothetical protein IWW37_000489 [Coemansia sp. RSA 2050]KAJ2734306.1 hypothetical protein IW152_002437 [Coemansia sp. BCRC 34962]
MCDFIFIPILCGTWNQIHSLGPESMRCPRCHNNAIQSIRRRTWMTLYCVPIVPVSRNRQILHCGICRWEGVPIAQVRADGEPRSNRRHMQTSPTRQDETQEVYVPERGMQPRPPQFQTVAYTENDYQAPPPPYSKNPDPSLSNRKSAKNTRNNESATVAAATQND